MAQDVQSEGDAHIRSTSLDVFVPCSFRFLSLSSNFSCIIASDALCWCWILSRCAWAPRRWALIFREVSFVRLLPSKVSPIIKFEQVIPYMPAVINSMLIVELCPLISVRNLATSSFCVKAHLIFFPASRILSPEPPSLKLQLYVLTFRKNNSMDSLHWSTTLPVVWLKALSSIIESQVRDKSSTSRSARSRDHSSWDSCWYSADAPWMSSRALMTEQDAAGSIFVWKEEAGRG